jgi:hypothetical protein
MLEKGQADGVFREDLDAKLIAVLMHGINHMILAQDSFVSHPYDKHLLIANFNYNYSRGIATEKGLKILDQYLNTFIENTKKTS